MSIEDEARFRPEQRQTGRGREQGRTPWLLAAAAVAIAGAAGAWVWWSRSGPPPAPVVSTPAQPPVAAPAQPAASAVKYPIESTEGVQPVRPLDVADLLADLLGRKAVATFLQTEDFARRFAATVDGLGRDHAPRLTWPVTPTPGRFTVEERPDGPVIAAENAQRYTPFVLLVATVDVAGAVKLYGRMYPLLQQAYRDLGFKDRYLNDRVVEVIDLLLASPTPTEPVRLQLMEVKGPVPSVQPWVRYEFADPQLEALAAGQKMLVRMGPVNQRRLMNKLVELREHLVKAQPAAVPR